MNKKIPVTVLSGFLGSGKTTLLCNILNNRKGLKVAVIVNDMAEVNIDSIIIDKDLSLSKTQEKMIEISNGCICCTLREDLLLAIRDLTLENKYDHIIIESSGISEPLPVAQTLTVEDNETGINLSKSVYIDSMITVVDASQFIANFASYEVVSDREKILSDSEQDDRNIVDLLVDQIEFADIIIINKIDLISDDDLIKIKQVITGLNNQCKIICSKNSEIDIKEMIGVKLFDLENYNTKATWISELSKGHENHKSELLEYGVGSFIYRADKPFDQDKFLHELNLGFDKIIRSKGIVRFEHDNDMGYIYSSAGNIAKIDPSGSRLATMSQSELQDSGYADDYEIYKNLPNGDRKQEIVFIGTEYDPKNIISRLNSCLV